MDLLSPDSSPNTSLHGTDRLLALKRSASESSKLSIGGASSRGAEVSALTGTIAPAELAVYRRMFTMFDLNDDGNIDVEELYEILRSLGVNLSRDQLVKMLNEVDNDNNGTIEFPEFAKLMKYGRDKGTGNSKELYRAFCSYISDAERAVLFDHTGRRLQAASKLASWSVDDPWKWGWDGALMLTAVWYGLMITLRDVINTPEQLLLIDLVVTIFLLCDIFINFNVTSVTAEYEVMDSRPEIAHHYLRGWFAIDLIGALPIDLLLYLATGGQTWYFKSFHHLRLLRILRVYTLFPSTNRATMSPLYVYFHFHLARFIRLIFWMILGTHNLAIIWLWIEKEKLTELNKGEMYTTAVYWVLYTITTVGYGDVPVDTVLKKWYACILFVIGTIVGGVVVGNIATWILKGDVETERKEKMVDTLGVVQFFDLPNALSREILAFQHHTLQHNLAASYAQVIAGLPQSIQEHIAMFIRMKFISMVPMFGEVSKECQLSLARALKNVVVPPETFIIRAGEFGYCMFFLGHGFADVISEEGTIITTLKKGGFFGELALLGESCKRNASIRALTYCDLFKLDKPDFQLLVESHSDLKWVIEKETAARKKAGKLQKKNEATGGGGNSSLTVPNVGGNKHRLSVVDDIASMGAVANPLSSPVNGQQQPHQQGSNYEASPGSPLGDSLTHGNSGLGTSFRSLGNSMLSPALSLEQSLCLQQSLQRKDTEHYGGNLTPKMTALPGAMPTALSKHNSLHQNMHPINSLPFMHHANTVHSMHSSGSNSHIAMLEYQFGQSHHTSAASSSGPSSRRSSAASSDRGPPPTDINFYGTDDGSSSTGSEPDMMPPPSLKDVATLQEPPALNVQQPTPTPRSNRDVSFNESSFPQNAHSGSNNTMTTNNDGEAGEDESPQSPQSPSQENGAQGEAGGKSSIKTGEKSAKQLGVRFRTASISPSDHSSPNEEDPLYQTLKYMASSLDKINHRLDDIEHDLSKVARFGASKTSAGSNMMMSLRTGGSDQSPISTSYYAPALTSPFSTAGNLFGGNINGVNISSVNAAQSFPGVLPDLEGDLNRGMSYASLKRTRPSFRSSFRSNKW